jgi:hypothetical protein
MQKGGRRKVPKLAEEHDDLKKLFEAIDTHFPVACKTENDIPIIEDTDGHDPSCDSIEGIPAHLRASENGEGDTDVLIQEREWDEICFLTDTSVEYEDQMVQGKQMLTEMVVFPSRVIVERHMSLHSFDLRQLLLLLIFSMS